MKSFPFLCALAAVAAVLVVPAASAQPDVSPLPLVHPVQDKNFYLLSVIERDAAVQAVLAADPQIKEIANARRSNTAAAVHYCKKDAVCAVKAFLWTDEEIQAVSLVLDRLATENPAVRSMVEHDLRPSYAYALFAKQPPGQFLADAWEVCARGLNQILSVYGEGLAPRYPAIDSISVDMKSADFQNQIFALLAQGATPTDTQEPFFSPVLKTALQLLAINHRDEAGRHESMEDGVNADAVKAIHATQWEKYPYTVIVVPGAGPSDPNTPLSEAGSRRCALAAKAWHDGKAPFLLVSGGYVHPAQTRFSEAMEMKQALIRDFQIPASAILVDPHARHTTTNMRNAAREIFRYHIPADKPALMISDASQTRYIAGQPFAYRCLRELGYVPYRIVHQNSDTELVFLPTIESLEQDPIDPLDP